MSAGGFYAWLARRSLFAAQGGRCHICGESLPRRATSRGITLDHVWPQSAARSRHVEGLFIGNVMLAHGHCNLAKADRRPTGCERLMLFAVNRALGLSESETGRWDGRRVA